LAKDPAAATARADCHDEAGLRGGVIGFAKGQLHVACHRPGHEQHVRVSRGGDKVNSESFNVIDGAVESVYFDFAAVTGTGIDFANVERMSEYLRGALFDLVSHDFQRFVLQLGGFC
jgi:hypothetical protein